MYFVLERPCMIHNYFTVFCKFKLLFAGNSGIHYVVQVILKLLDPKTSEYTATFVGRLVSLLISRLGLQLGEDLDLILRAVLSKMQQATTLSVIQVLTLKSSK